MGPVRSRDSARSKPRGKIHPGMADGEGGPPLSRTDSILGLFEHSARISVWGVAEVAGIYPMLCTLSLLPLDLPRAA